MNTILCIAIFVVIFSITFCIRIREDRPARKHKPQVGYYDLNAKYLARQRKINSVKILRLYSEIDSIIIRSLLDSAKINSYIEFPNMNNLYAGFAIQGYCDSYLYVERRRVFDAKRIITKYLKFNRIKNQANYKTDIRQIIEIALGGYSVPHGKNRNLPELLI